MSNKNLTGGSFDSGLPSDCFKSNNPCCQTAVAGDRVKLEKATIKTTDPAKRPIEGFDQPGDDYRMAAPHCL